MINRKFSISRIQDAKTIANGGRVGSKFQNVFNFGNRQVSYYTPKVGTNKINIIPYEIKTERHPLIRSGVTKLGDPDCQDFYFPLQVHRWFGPLKAHIVCPSQFGQPCPICERRKMLYEQNDPSYKDYKPSKRTFYNVEDLEEPGQIKIFETSEFLFQKELMDEASQGGDEGTINFADCDNGKTVRFRASEAQFNDNKFLEFKSFAFEDRNPVPDELLTQSISFDQYLNIYTYDEIQSLMQGEIPGSAGNNSAPQQTVAPQVVQQPVAPQPVQQTIQQPVQVVGQPVQQINVGQEQVVQQPVNPTISNLVNQAAAPAQPVQQQVVQQPVQPQVVQQAAPATGGMTCPFGYVCGKDTDNKPECDSCQLWDKCIEQA